jgi:hypothetical protein
LDEAKRRCAKPLEGEPVVYSSDFKWGVTFAEMKQKFEEIYQTDKRLLNRAYYDPNQNSFVLPFRGGPQVVKIGETFIRSVTRHIERGLQLKYMNFVFFPDMGHSHVHVPQKYYDEVLAPIKEFHLLYEKMLNEPTVKFLYHTAEQLNMVGEDKMPLPDRFLQWRLYTRNLVGYNDGGNTIETLFEPESDHNTARGEEGYRYWGGGFNIHASKNGCFAYKQADQTYYFDISLDDLPSKTSGGL